MTEVRYQTEVVQIGSMVEEFRNGGLMILFADLAPAELHDFCVLHRPSVKRQAPEPGDLLQIGSEQFTVTAIGSVAGTNLLELGHITLKADGASEPALPGDISVEAKPLPLPLPGCLVRFVGADAPAGAFVRSQQTEEMR